VHLSNFWRCQRNGEMAVMTDTYIRENFSRISLQR